MSLQQAFTRCILMSILGGSVFTPAHSKSVTGLQQVIDLAIKQDLALDSAEFKKQGLLHRAQGVNTLPQPKLSLDLMNLPSDSIKLDQEPMTQIRVGVSQAIPRGDVQQIAKTKFEAAAAQMTAFQAVRSAKVTREVTQIWLDAYLAQQSIKLLKRDMSLFEQMVDIATASYQSAVSQRRQQDVIKAQVQLTQLHSQMIQQQQKLEQAKAKLAEYVPTRKYLTTKAANQNNQPVVNLDRAFDHAPKSEWLSKAKLAMAISDDSESQPSNILPWVSQHPELAVLKTSKQVAQSEVELKKQDFKPEWRVSASYGLRDEPKGVEPRSDLFSLGVSVTMPLFDDTRQARNLSAARANVSAAELEVQLKQRQLQAGLAAEVANLQALIARQALYQDVLLTQLSEQSEALLTAYTNDDGGFDQVLNAKITELESQLVAEQLAVQVLQAYSRAQYYLVKFTPSSLPSSSFHSAVNPQGGLNNVN